MKERIDDGKRTGVLVPVAKFSICIDLLVGAWCLQLLAFSDNTPEVH